MSKSDLDPVDAALLGLDPDVDVEDLGGHVGALALDDTSVATFSSSVMASSKSAVGIRSTIRERSARAVLVGLGVVLGDGAPVDVDDLADVEDRLADVAGPQLDVAGRDHLLRLDARAAGVAAVIGGAAGVAAAAAGSAGRAGPRPRCRPPSHRRSRVVVAVAARSSREEDQDGRGPRRERRALEPA